jgi:nitroimidazol reductase NimA-like FMN-containing flavoprotein (pyridoxamine 5'-phosphate oxidase superfamily)
MLETMKDLMTSKDTCVMATVCGNEPHCSLMSYAISEDCKEIYLMTSRKTRKYNNLLANPAVSLLFDTRDADSQADRSQTKALTAAGHIEWINDDATRLRIKEMLLARHPHLQIFADDPDTEFFVVKVKSLQLLEGVSEASFAFLD